MTVRLTREADADLVDIFRHTRDEFGVAQAARYREIIRHAFDMIDADPMRAGTRALDQFGPQVRQFHLGSAAVRKSGAAHIVIYHVGEKSVRGYVRRHLGPLSSTGDPLGGLSLVEGSLELRRPIWKELSGAVFVDFGQVSKRAFDLPFGDLQFSRGFGVNYTTAVGPLSLYVGFPVHPPHGDRPWQINFSIGTFF